MRGMGALAGPIIDMEKRGGRWRKERPIWLQVGAPFIPALAGIVLLVVLALAVRGPWQGRAVGAEFVALSVYLLWARWTGRI